MSTKYTKRVLSFVLALAMVLTSAAFSGIVAPKAQAAKKATLKLSKTSVSLLKGEKTTLKITKKNVKKIKKQAWKSSNKAVATVSKKGLVTAVKAGTAKISCKVTYIAKGSSKKKTKTIKATVAVKEAPVTKPTAKPGTNPTKEPDVKPTEKPVDITESDLSDPSIGIADVETVTDEAVTEDTSAKGTTAKSIERSNNGKTTEIRTFDTGMMRKKLTAHQLVRFMKQGWNLSNTLEACAGEEFTKDYTKATEYETLWGSPITTKPMITGIKKAGFDSIRIPVAWSNMMAKDGKYTINDAYLNRVENVMNYCFENDMYVVLNIHYDGGWWGMFGATKLDENGKKVADMETRNEAWKKYISIWTQIAERYKNYSDHLIFESANEELGHVINEGNRGLNTAVNGVVGNLSESEIYENVNKINQKFVEIVRKTGGNNLYRQLLIAGYNTDIAKTVDDRYKMPVDTVASNGKTKLNLSIHYYTPGAYCIGEDAAASFYQENWGPTHNSTDVIDMHKTMDMLSKYTNQGYGVIIGEYGPQLLSKHGVIDFLREVMTYGPKNYMAPMLWNGGIYSRSEGLINYDDIANLLMEVTGRSPEGYPVDEGAPSTGPVKSSIAEEGTVVATWEGKWTRTNNKGCLNEKDEYGNNKPDTSKGEVGYYSQTSCSEDLSVKSNDYYWQLFFNYDWSKLENPAVRVTMADDTISSKADLQIGYAAELDGETRFDTFPHDDLGKIMVLNIKKIKGTKPYLELTTPSEGGSIVKVEIIDANLDAE